MEPYNILNFISYFLQQLYSASIPTSVLSMCVPCRLSLLIIVTTSLSLTLCRMLG